MLGSTTLIIGNESPFENWFHSVSKVTGWQYFIVSERRCMGWSSTSNFLIFKSGVLFKPCFFYYRPIVRVHIGILSMTITTWESKKQKHLLSHWKRSPYRPWYLPKYISIWQMAFQNCSRVSSLIFTTYFIGIVLAHFSCILFVLLKL